MNPVKYISYILIAVFLFSCSPGKQLPMPAAFSQPATADTGKIQLNGYYASVKHLTDPLEQYSTDSPVFFTTGNRIMVIHGAYSKTDSSLFTCTYYKQVKSKDLGRYMIEGNKITAFAPIAVAIAGGTFYFTYNLNFEGTITDKNLITNWKAVPPFPKRIKKNDIEEPQNNNIFNGHDLKFVRADSAACLAAVQP